MALFILHFTETFNNEQDAEQRNVCIVAALEAAGFENDGLMKGLGSFFLENTTFEKAEPFLRLQIVETVFTSCIDQTYCDCSDLTLDACEEHAFCTKHYGKSYDAVQECFGDKVAAGCSSANRVCTAESGTAKGSDGKCWRFPSGCLPETDYWEWQYDEGVCEGVGNQGSCD